VTRGGGRDWGGASAQERREAGPREYTNWFYGHFFLALMICKGGGGRMMIDNLARGVYVSGPTASQDARIMGRWQHVRH
jgi:hypothetical protein